MKYTEIILIILVWLVLLFTPILFREDIYSPIRRSVLLQLQILIPLLVVFLINRFFLVPRLLFRGKQASFIISVVGIIVLFTAGSYVYDTKIKNIPPPEVPQLTEEIRTPPYAFPGGVDTFGNLRPAQSRQPKPIPPFANFRILSVLFVGFDTGLRSGLRGINIENEKVRLEKENVASQLVLLRNQVSPHFLMNTLNNIHTLIEIDSEKAQDTIERLSTLMRYLLYDSAQNTIELKKEIEFLTSFIALMQLRHSEEVEVTVDLPDQIPETRIPPMLFISLLENAFKHGVSYPLKSYIHFELRLEEASLHCNIKNSNHQVKTNLKGEYSGIGLVNIKKSLKLLYGDNFRLDILDKETEFEVNLKIPV